MHFSLSQQRIAFLTAACMGSSQVMPALASPSANPHLDSTFDSTEVLQDNFVLLATPYNGGKRHQLTIVEQKNIEQNIEQNSDSRPCWSEEEAMEVASSENMPLVINPLVLGFNLNGTCSRNPDSNDYSIRMGGEDLNWRYSLKLMEHEGEIMLVGVPTGNPAEAKLLIARSRERDSSGAELVLEPGWRLTKRSYNGKTLEHLYLSHDETLARMGGAH